MATWARGRGGGQWAFIAGGWTWLSILQSLLLVAFLVPAPALWPAYPLPCRNSRCGDVPLSLLVVEAKAQDFNCWQLRLASAVGLPLQRLLLSAPLLSLRMNLFKIGLEREEL